MNRFSLSDASLTRITAQLNLSGTFNHTCKSAFSPDAVHFRLKVERAEPNTTATVEMGSERHSITLLTASPRKHLELADFIDAIANGRVDSGEPSPPRITKLDLAVDQPQEQTLDTEQLESLRLFARKGGFLSLDVGLSQPIEVAIHRTVSRDGITVIACVGERRPRTICFTSYANEPARFKQLVTSIENLAARATPAQVAA